MAAHPLTRGEITELAGRLHGLLEMIAVDELTATTGMTYRLQGAVVALDAVLGRDSSLLGPMFAVISQSFVCYNP
jgi:hypothetical protein